MSKQHGPLNLLLGALTGMLLGICVLIALAIFILGILSDANAHDQINIHHTKGKISTTHHYERGNPALQDMVLIYTLRDQTPIIYSVDNTTREDWCADSNAYLRALRALVDEEVARTPEFADIYQVSYDSIDGAWCK